MQSAFHTQRDDNGKKAEPRIRTVLLLKKPPTKKKEEKNKSNKNLPTQQHSKASRKNHAFTYIFFLDSCVLWPSWIRLDIVSLGAEMKAADVKDVELGIPESSPSGPVWISL